MSDILFGAQEMDRLARRTGETVSAQRNTIIANAMAVQQADASRARGDAQLARRTRFPFPVFDDGGRALATVREQMITAQEAIERAPRLGPAMANPERYARIADDLERMIDISEAIDRHRVQRWSPADSARWEAAHGALRAPPPVRPTAGNFVRGVWQSLVSGGEMTRGGLNQWLGDSGALDPLVRRFNAPRSGDRDLREAEQARLRSDAATPEFTSWYARGAYSGVSSLAQIAPALVLSVATRSYVPLLVFAGTQTSGSAYGRYRARGATVGEASTGAGIEGGIEVATELIPMRWLVGQFGRLGFGRFVTGLLARDVPSEQIATLVQDATDTAIANPDATWGDYLRARPDAAVQTAVSTIVQASLIGGPAHLLRDRARGAEDEEAMRNVDRVMESAADSPVRVQSPEDFHAVVSELADGTPAENIYVPAEAVRELFQTPEELSEDSFWGGYAEQMSEAEALGGDVVIPLAEAATHLAGTPQWEALKDKVRATPGGVSRAEAAKAGETFENEMQASGERVSTDIETERERAAPVDKIYEGMRDQLILAGLKADAASHLATLFAQRQAARAERMGRALTGEEGNAIEVRAAAEGEKAKGARVLSHTFRDGPRGRISFRAEGPATIDLFENRNLSTAVHEFGHFFLEELKADAGEAMKLDEGGARQVFGDWETIRAWFKREGHEIGPDGEIPTGAHELFARAFERYALEGKAPSSALHRAFEAFRSWLLTIYKTVSRLRAPITPEVRDVMGRMLATDDAIAAAAEEQYIKLAFTTAEQAGMPSAEFAAYQDLANDARNEAHAALLRRVMATVRAARTKEYRVAKQGARAEVAQAVDDEPVFKALRLLRNGRMGDEEARKVKLDRQHLLDTYGEDALDRIPRSVPPIYADEGSVHPDTIAEETGFSSGDDLIRTLMAHEQTRQKLRESGDKRSPRQVLIDEQTAARMAERYGDPLRDGSIEEEARALIHNDKQGEVIAAEIRALGRQTNRPPTPYSVARKWAAEKIAGGRVVDVASGSAIQQYQRAARNAGKEAEVAILKGDADETYRQKQRQMLNTALTSEAKKAKDRVDVAVRRLSRLARRRTMASVDQAYLDQVHGLLEQVDLKARSQESIDRQQSFEAWAAEQEAAGHDVIAPQSFAATLGQAHWSRLSVEQLVGLDDTVQQIMHLGRLKQTLLDGQERRAFDEIVGEAETAAAKLPPKPPSDLMQPSFGERLKARVASADAALLKIETIVDWLDGKSSEGVFNRIVFKPIAEAQARAADMFVDYMGQLNEALRQVPKERLARWADRVTPPELLNRETGNPFVFTRAQLVSMALNMGNEGNAQRLTDGYGWSEANVMAVLNRELHEEEWAYVQSVWDIIGGLWPHIEEMERDINGFAPEKVPARPLETSAGTLAGGYFPAVYDSTKDYAAERNAGRESDLFESHYTRATTRASATKERVDQVKRPIYLNLGIITRHVGEVIHDITHREVVMNAQKFLSAPRVMKAIDSSLGPEIRQQFQPWLKFVANQWAMERAGNEGLGWFMNRLRTNTTVVGMGFRFSTMMMQLAGYSNSFEVVGATWVSQAVAQTTKHPIETFNFVMERSGEIRHRMDTLDRDIDQGIKRLAGRINPLTEVRRFAYHGIGYMDRMVVIPTWIGAYNRALAGGLDEAAAIYAADKAVRQSQGSGAAKDMAAVVRGTGQWGQALKLMTMFYSYLSAVYQRQRTLGRDVRTAKAKDIPGLMARAWWLLVVPPLLSELLAGRGPDDDDEWGWWASRQMMSQSLGAIPGIRDLARPVWDGIAGDRAFDYQLSPVQQAGQSVVRVAKDVGRVSRGEETRRGTRDTLEAVGYWTGLVPGQAAAATQFLVDVGSGEAQPETVSDYYEGLTTGRLEEE